MSVRVAIDGPSGAGKSTIAKTVSQKLGFIYLDTGAMYRSVGLYALRQGITPSDANAVEGILDDIHIKIEYINNAQAIFLNGENVSEAIRQPEVSIAASDVSAIPAVRLKLVAMQRELAKGADVIMDGRDIGSYVLPDAELKIFLTASSKARAERRFAELAQKGVKTTFEEVLTDIEYRDKNDSSREFAPLKIADGAVVVDTSEMDLEQSIEVIENMIKKIR